MRSPNLAVLIAGAALATSSFANEVQQTEPSQPSVEAGETQATEEDAEAAAEREAYMNVVVCRSFADTMSRMRNRQRTCLTRAEWARIDGGEASSSGGRSGRSSRGSDSGSSAGRGAPSGGQQQPSGGVSPSGSRAN